MTELREVFHFECKYLWTKSLFQCSKDKLVGGQHCILVTHILFGGSERLKNLLEEAYGNVRGHEQSRLHFLRIELKS